MTQSPLPGHDPLSCTDYVIDVGIDGLAGEIG
jgi:hypothetical protein